MSILTKVAAYRRRCTQAISRAHSLGDEDTVEELYERIRRIDDETRTLKAAQKSKKWIEKQIKKERINKDGEWDVDDLMSDWNTENHRISSASTELERIMRRQISKSRRRNPGIRSGGSWTKAQFVKTVKDYLMANASPGVKVRGDHKQMSVYRPGSDDYASISLDWNSESKIGDLAIDVEYSYGLYSEDAFDTADLIMYQLYSQEKTDRDLRYILHDFLHDYGNLLVKRQNNPRRKNPIDTISNNDLYTLTYYLSDEYSDTFEENLEALLSKYGVDSFGMNQVMRNAFEHQENLRNIMNRAYSSEINIAEGRRYVTGLINMGLRFASNPSKGTSVLGALILGGIIGHSMKK